MPRKQEASSAERGQAVHEMRARFSQGIVGAITLEAVLFGAWPAIAAAVAVVAIDMIVPRWSPLAGAFERLAPQPRARVRQPVYRFAGAVIGVMLVSAIAAFAALADGAGAALGIVAAATALGSAVFGFRFWEWAHGRLPGRRTP